MALPSDPTFITRLDPHGEGPRLAVKDVIDVAGVVTTAGSPALARSALPAPRDAACLAGARAAGAQVVGKANLHELALGTTGVNPFFGTPVNPFDPGLVPGGSSSGSAVAVATGQADVAFGTDTAGSIRIPSAWCGTAGLKTTFGRVPLEGVWPVAPSLDVVGPMAADVEGLVLGMALLEPDFVAEGRPPRRVGRVRVPAASAIDAACDRALALTGWDVVEAEVGDWVASGWEAAALLAAECWASNGSLVEGTGAVAEDTAAKVLAGKEVSAADLAAAQEARARLRRRLEAAFAAVELLCLPTLGRFPPRLEEPEDLSVVGTTLAANVAGVPALALPVPTDGPLPASLQLVGPWGAEEHLLVAGRAVEVALGSGRS